MDIKTRVGTSGIWLACAWLLVGGSSAAADPIVIDTIGAGGLSDELVGNFGEPNAATAGQTFIAPAARLDSFTFYLFHDIDTGPARFRGYVTAWDGEKATGPLLYKSGERTVTTPLTAVPATFDTQGVGLIPGQSYIAFLSASGLFDGVDDFTGQFLQGDSYAGGGAFALPNGNDFSQIFTTPWHGGLHPLDVAFRAQFAATPEPGTLVLFGIGFAGVAARWKRGRMV
ncbi:MAG TPA: PEP-CTERM sorting domain-containing protein [Vicinamibacterales bacterium]